MAKKQSLYLGVALCSLVLFGLLVAFSSTNCAHIDGEKHEEAPAEVAGEPEDERDILSVEVEGHTITVPVFENTDKPFSPQRIQFDRDLTVELLDITRKLADKLVKENRTPLVATPLLGKLTGLAFRKSNEIKQLNKEDPSPPVKSEYVHKMGAMLSQILDSKSDQKLSGEECYDMIDLLLKAWDELSKESPVGLYLDWPELSIDGTKMAEYSAPVVQWFRDNGYKLALYGGKKLAGILNKVTL